MPPFRLPVLALLLSAVARPAGAAPFVVTDWRMQQDLVIPRAGPTRVRLPVETLDAAQPGLADLRLTDPAGREVAFALEQERTLPPVARPPRKIATTIEDAATVVTMETGTKDIIFALQFTVGFERLLTRATIEASDDGIRWRSLGHNLPVVDQEPHQRAFRLRIPPGVYPHLRIFLGHLGGRYFVPPGLSLVMRTAHPPRPVAVAVRVIAREEVPGESRLTLSLPGAHLFLATLTVDTPERVFYRPVRLIHRVFADGVIREVTLAQGLLGRADISSSSPSVPLRLKLDRTIPGRELILVVENGDSPPLALNRIAAERWPAFAVFDAAEPGRYTIYAGNPRASAPRYDVGALIAPRPEPKIPEVTPGSLEANPAYRPAEPLPEIPMLGAPIDVAPWAYRALVRIPAAGVQQFELPPEVLARARPDLGDLRLVSQGRQIPFVGEHTSLTRALATTVQSKPDPKHPRISRWRITLPDPGLPLTGLTATVATPLFQREVRLYEELEDDRGYKTRRWLGQQRWVQTPDHRATTFSLAIQPGLETGTLWLETDDGDNPPIDLAGVRVTYRATRLLFKAGTDAAVFLYFGNPSVAAPRYDLDLVGGQLLAADKHTPTLGRPENLKTRTLAATLALAGRGGVFFWSMLGLAVIVLLVVIARLLPKAPSA